MAMYITFNDLRHLKDSLPEGAMRMIAKKSGYDEETVRSYFGGDPLHCGDIPNIHYEKGPNGGLVRLEDDRLYYMAKEILDKASDN
ncbi:MAG: DNA-binding protein [Sphingobacteriales bacterium]|nr:DNA-binding protein [Sphingobacteriales bacterium]